MISVIVPIYNVEKYLRRCIDSILSSDYKDLEIILVNDGSLDNCLDICKEYQSKDERIKVIDKENGGLSSARNAGLDLAKGEYISFIDSDDYISSDYFSFMLKNMEETNADISVCGHYMAYENGKITNVSRENVIRSFNSYEGIDAMNMRFFGFFDFASWDKLYKKTLFHDIRFPVGKKSEDWFTLPLLFKRAKKICYNSQPKYYYFQRIGSITRDNNNVNFDAIEASDFVLDMIRREKPQYEDGALISCVFAYIGVYNHIFLNKRYIKETREISEKVKDHYKKIHDKKKIVGLKKIQLFLFLHAKILYKMCYLIIK